MIPIRRVAGDLREVRWANVFVEFVLLILGILIALAVNGWLEDRRDAQLEREYLGRLQQDLDQNLAILREYIGFEQKQVDDGVLAYRALRGVDEYDRETVATALSHLADRRTLRLVRSTYQDLIGTGSLGLIRDPVLRDKVVRLFEDSERMVAVVDRNNQVLVDEGFGLPLFQSGLVSPRLSQNNAVLNDGVRKLEARLRVPVDAAGDRLWSLPSDARERGVLAILVLRRTIVSTTAVTLAEGMQRQHEAVRDAVAAAIER